MNALPRLAVLSLSMLGLAACASMHDSTVATAPVTAGQQPPSDTDSAYVQRVERNALKYGITVQWVHAPRTGQGATKD